MKTLTKQIASLKETLKTTKHLKPEHAAQLTAQLDTAIRNLIIEKSPSSTDAQPGRLTEDPQLTENPQPKPIIQDGQPKPLTIKSEMPSGIKTSEMAYD